MHKTNLHHKIRVYISHGFFVTILTFLGLSQSNAQKPFGDYRCGHAHQEVFDVTSSSSVDVEHYSLEIDMRDMANRKISALATIIYRLEHASDAVDLDLEGLTVDSILRRGKSIIYTSSATEINIQLGEELASGILDTVMVYYSGSPTKDASWGGFYFSGDYAFNLGVAFTSSPHNYGRVWYPCVDNFTDRATYTYSVRCKKGYKAMCNGLLQTETTHPDESVTYVWDMNDAIPTYLSSIAVAPYTLNTWEHKNIPITLASVASDSANMAASFINLNECIDAYLERYGQHNFDRIGFNAVPFNGGAMEHATNIAYPRFGVGGDLTYETLYAHELGHHWWGNTVTCRTAEDMWINEGWASFSERVFLEWVYGKDRYNEDISSNHRAVLHYAHLRDGDTLAISGVGHSNTYGMHVYDKGADVAHTLRGYMGDTAFFHAVNSFLVRYKFKDVSSDDLKNHFAEYTKHDMESFFKNWVYNPGFPHFSVLGFESKPKGNLYQVQLNVGQRLRFAPEFFEKVPMDVTFFSSDMKRYTLNVELSKERQNMVLDVPFDPVYVALDLNGRISDAITDYNHMISDTGTYEFGDAMATMDVIEVNDSSFVRIEHHWVGADPYFNGNDEIFISRERYWTIDGVWSKDFDANVTIEYFGRKTGTNYAAGYLDVDLLRNTEESLVLMYRPNPSAKWTECPDYRWEMGSKYDKRGSFTIHSVQRGQYCFGVREQDRLAVEETSSTKHVLVYPNPASDSVSIEVKNARGSMIEITNSAGQVVLERRVNSALDTQKLDVSEWTPGIYFIGIVLDDKPYAPRMMLVR